MFSVVLAFVWFGNDNSALGTVTDHVHYDIDRSTGSFEVTYLLQYSSNSLCQELVNIQPVGLKVMTETNVDSLEFVTTRDSIRDNLPPKHSLFDMRHFSRFGSGLSNP